MYVILFCCVIIVHVNGAKTGDEFGTFCADLKALMERHSVEIVVQPTSQRGENDVTMDDNSNDVLERKSIPPINKGIADNIDDERKKFLDPDSGLARQEEPEDLYLSSSSEKKTVLVSQDAQRDADMDKEDDSPFIFSQDRHHSYSKLSPDNVNGDVRESVNQDEECDEEGTEKKLDFHASPFMESFEDVAGKKEEESENAGEENRKGEHDVKTIHEILLNQESEVLDQESSTQNDESPSAPKGANPNVSIKVNSLLVDSEKDRKGNSPTGESLVDLESQVDHETLKATYSDVSPNPHRDVIKDQLVRQLHDIINQMRLREN